MSQLHAPLALAASILVAATGIAAPQDLTPVVAASIRDEPPDGLGDSFNTVPFTGLLREQSTREDRAIQEFDVAGMAGTTVSSATLAGTVHVNNSFDNGVRTFDFLLYDGNGVADLSDFQSAATLVGSGSYHPPIDTSFNYSFDVTAVVQGLLNGGATDIGLLVDPTSSPNFPNILSDAVSVLSIQLGGGPGTNYCISVPNSTGSASTISGSGSSSLSANNLVLTADNLPPQPGIFIAGPAQAQIPFFNGFLCVGQQGLQRFLNTAAPAGGSITEAVDYGTSAPGGLNVVAGLSYNYQRWNRDPAGGGGNANFSNGLELTHTP